MQGLIPGRDRMEPMTVRRLCIPETEIYCKSKVIMQKFKTKLSALRPLRPFLLLWSTQALSALGSGMTSFGACHLGIRQSGSGAQHGAALDLFLRAVRPAEHFRRRAERPLEQKVTMLVCDLFAAGTTAAVFLLLHTGRLAVWHLYALNILNGLMNTVQQPASEVLRRC